MSCSLEKIASHRPLSGAKAILSHFMPVDIECVYSFCCLLQCEDEVFLWQNQRTTMQHLVGHYSPSADVCKIAIKFYGGPLGRGAWHTGSVLAFLLDHIANTIIMDGYLKTKAKFNLTSNNNVV